MSAVTDTSYGRAVERPTDAAALACSLFARHRWRVYRYCLRSLRSPHDAEDALQQTFVNALQALRAGVTPRVEAAWLLRIAHNVCLERRRNADRRARLESATCPDSLDTIAAPPASATGDEPSVLEAALSGLEPRQREVLVLREWRGLSYGEIASVLELSHSAVESLLFRARRSLARGLDEGRRLRSALNWVGVLTSRRAFLSSAVGKTVAVAACCGVAVIATPALEQVVSRHPGASRGTAVNRSSDRAPAATTAGPRGRRQTAAAGTESRPSRRGGAVQTTTGAGGGSRGKPSGGTSSAPDAGGDAVGAGSGAAVVDPTPPVSKAGTSPEAASTPTAQVEVPSASTIGAVSLGASADDVGVDAGVSVGSDTASVGVQAGAGSTSVGVDGTAAGSDQSVSADADASVAVGDTGAAASVGATVGATSEPTAVDVGVSVTLPGP